MKRIAWVVAGVAVAAASGAMLAACGSSYTCADYKDCVAEAGDVAADGKKEAGTDAREGGHKDAPPDGKGDAGADQDAGGDAGDADASDALVDADTGPTCTPGAAPADGGCITPTSGVFVSTGGMDATGHGTMALPFASVSYALGHLGGATAVYVCGGAYSDQITVDAGVSLYGGLTCASTPWVYSASAVAVVAATSPGFAMKVDGVSAAVDVEDMEFDGADASAGGTTIAVWANASTDVTLARVTVVGATAGDGAKGPDGTANPNYGPPNADAGADASGNVPGNGGQNACADGTVSIGGLGGTGGASPLGGAGGTPSYTTPLPVGADGAGGAGGIVCSPAPGSYGQTGGAAGIAPANAGSWSLSTSAWVPSTADAGSNGGPGQGGGGGGGNTGGGGGGGGAGGCGGSSGQGGVSGGASFALLSLSSTVTLDHCTIVGGAGGAGGGGGDGQMGQQPGTGGAGTGGLYGGCNGGNGGFGQGGGGGAGGAGGPGAAIAYVGTKPKDKGGASTITKGSTTPTAASGGAGGDGGTVANPDNGTSGNGGPVTKPMAMLALPTS